jgi:putative tryptophan/tyrosine transport system substrate-binding protein
MAIHIRRREFIITLGGASAWPLAARAQQTERVRRIGVLQLLAENDPETVARHAALENALQGLGWTVGRNLQIDYRYGADDANRLLNGAAELVALGHYRRGWYRGRGVVVAGDAHCTDRVCGRR